MLFSSLIPLFLFLIFISGGYSFVSVLVDPLVFAPQVIGDNGTSTISYQEETFSSIFTNLLPWVFVFGAIGFLSGRFYESGKKKWKSWIISLALALIPWILWLLLTYHFFQRVVYV